MSIGQIGVEYLTMESETLICVCHLSVHKTKNPKAHAGHTPVIVKRALIGSKGGWKLSIIFKFKCIVIGQ